MLHPCVISRKTSKLKGITSDKVTKKKKKPYITPKRSIELNPGHKVATVISQTVAIEAKKMYKDTY